MRRGRSCEAGGRSCGSRGQQRRPQPAAVATLVLCGLLLGAQADSSKGRSSGEAYAAAFKDLSCISDVVLQPGSTADVAAHITAQRAASAAAGRGLKVRATRNHFHSTLPFNCPGQASSVYDGQQSAGQQQPGNSSSTTSVTLLLDKMDNVLAVDVAKHQVRVQAGMLVTQLLEEASRLNMSLPLGSVPAFGDLTLGGVLATGAHGTGYRGTSMLADLVLQLTWVDGSGNVRVSNRSSTAGRALVGGLGVAGVVTELALQLQPLSRTRVSTRFKQNDQNLVADVREMLKVSPHVLVVWRPDLKLYTGFITQELPMSVAATGNMAQMDFPPFVARVLGKSLQVWQADVHDRQPLAAVPVLAAIHETSVGHFYATQDNGQPMLDGVGDTNRMQSTSCGSKCLWNLGANIAMDDVHFSIELAQLQDWVNDAQAIIAADLWSSGRKRHRVLSPGYFWLRFGHGSADFISHTSNMSEPVHVQMSFMKSIDDPQVPNKFGWVLEVLEQLTLCKYKGKPHWGKNKPRDFTHASCRVRDHLPFWQQMRDFQAESDPQHIFEPPLFTAMAAGRPAAAPSPGCALRGECFCADSSHCARGYRCQPSAAFPEYKMCGLP